MKDVNNMDAKLFELIESYLDGRMDFESKTAFEIKMKAEPALLNEVEIQRMLRGSVQAGAMQEQLDEIHTQVIGDTSVVQSSNATMWKIAAGIALILGIGALIYNANSTNDVLFAEYATIDPGLPVTMGVTDSYDFYDGMVDYKQADYARAISEWKVLTELDSENDTLSYYIASAHFARVEYPEAIAGFEKLLTDSNSSYAARAQWYLCLAYLKTGQEGQLREITPVEASKYADRILEIQKRLGR